MPPPRRQSRRTLWIALGIVGVALLACCGGGIGLLAVVKAVNDRNERAHNTPTTVTVGAGFEHDRFVADEGWEVAEDDGVFDIVDLALTNDARRPRQANLSFTVYRGDTIVADISCTAGTLGAGETEVADCFSPDAHTSDFDEVRVADSL